MNDVITVTGYLGKDPEIRDTKERTVTLHERRQSLIFEHRGAKVPDRLDDICEEPAEYDVTFRSREYGVLSLATHHWQGSKRITTWRRVVIWNVDRMEHIGVRIARKGSKVEVKGRLMSFTTRDGRTLEQIELIHLRILQLK